VSIYQFFLFLFLNLSLIVLPVSHLSGLELDKIDINKSEAWLLQHTLHGIGEVKAAAIVKYRETYGPFKSIYELDNVPGIGPKTIQKNFDKMFLTLPEESEETETSSQEEQFPDETSSQEEQFSDEKNSESISDTK
jgi:competence protein ComEA